MTSRDFAEFDIEILGPKPEDVSFGDLSEFIRALEQAIAATFGSTDEGASSLRLVGVNEGSDRLTLAVPRAAAPCVAQISAHVRQASYSQLPRRAHFALSEMSRVVRRNRWGFRFVRNARLDIPEAVVSADQEIPPPEVEEIRGATSILAKCMRAGGVKPRAELRLPNRPALLHVDITEEFARQLGGRMYQDVVLAGEATWDAVTWEITAFSVTSIAPYESVPLDVSFREIAQSAGDAWAGVDAEAFTTEQRAEPAL